MISKKSKIEFQYLQEKIIKVTRNFFYGLGFHEVITPILTNCVPLEPNIYPFSTDWNTIHSAQKLYLSTSPERGLKLMLAEGIGNCFAFGKSFRNLESAGPLHSPEFLMLEWYRQNTDYIQIMKDSQDFFSYIIDNVFGEDKPLKLTYSTPWKIFSLEGLFGSYAHLDYQKILGSESYLIEQAKKKQYQTKKSLWSELFDQIFVNEIEPCLPIEPCFITDFPALISPLCKPKKENSKIAERFELYINRTELANGNTENTDYHSIEKVFKGEQEKRLRMKLPYQDVDSEFLNALKKMSKHQYAGIGFGIDRLTKILMTFATG